ncbi:PaREP1 family protein [Thermofilum sp.]|uniref:PaREP1 family protein n=2 Tax=Thermofilum sp. TaxID=1961369 RepID=UPI003167D362
MGTSKYVPQRKEPPTVGRPTLDPEIKKYLDLAVSFLEEGKSFVEKNPVQASEKLYKAAEESVKLLALYLGVSDVLAQVRQRNRWTVTDLEKAVEAISQKLGDWFMASWDTAWALHVWGFHEAKFDSEAVKIRLPYIEKIVEEAKKIVSGEE